MGHQLVWMGWQSIQIVGASACVFFILHQKIQKVTKCTFWYQLTQVILDKVQRAVKWLCVCVCVYVCFLMSFYVKVSCCLHLFVPTMFAGCRLESQLRGSLDWNDTFLNIEHLKSSFPGYAVHVKTSNPTVEPRPPFR